MPSLTSIYLEHPPLGRARGRSPGRGRGRGRGRARGSLLRPPPRPGGVVGAASTRRRSQSEVEEGQENESEAVEDADGDEGNSQIEDEEHNHDGDNDGSDTSKPNESGDNDVAPRYPARRRAQSGADNVKEMNSPAFASSPEGDEIKVWIFCPSVAKYFEEIPRVSRLASRINSKTTPSPARGARGGRSSRTATGRGRGRGRGRSPRTGIIDDTTTEILTKPPIASNFMGDDGNLFHCSRCRDVGDVVCCDGCPEVYHPWCVPEGTSRKSLEADEDPWYCPKCRGETHESSENTAQDSGRSTTKRKRTDRTASSVSGASNKRQPRTKRKGSAGNQDDDPSPDTSDEDIENEMAAAKDRLFLSGGRGGRGRGRGRGSGRGGRGRGQGRGKGNPSVRGDSTDMSSSTRRGPGRPRLTQAEKAERKRIRELERMLHDEAGEAERKHRISTKKPTSASVTKLEEMTSEEDEDELFEDANSEEDDGSPYSPGNLDAERPASATPAFHFFLNEQRNRIEKSLSKKDLQFKSMKKGLEQNTIIAKEGAALWLTLSAREHKRYTDMSLDDFENRIIAWKEDEALRVMYATVPDNEDERDGIDQDPAIIQDEEYWHRRHRELSVPNQMRCVRAEQDNRVKPTRNRVLLELLQDSRFHPLPIVDTSRSEADASDLNTVPGKERVVLPYYNVEGPLATSVGDACLGCTRGWAHYCPVLKRRFPAVEIRAKLQPPMSSLMATRIGLGIRAEGESRELVENAPKSVKEMRDKNRENRYTPVAGFSLSDPSLRNDEVGQFIEEAIAIRSYKLQELPGEMKSNESASPRSMATKVLSRGILPTAKVRKPREEKSYMADKASKAPPSLFLCGGCGKLDASSVGCVSCRGSKLVAQMTKRGNNRTKAGFLLVVPSVMSARTSLRISNFNKQTNGEKAIAAVLADKAWKPNVIMPLDNVILPSIKQEQIDDVSSSDSEDDSDAMSIDNQSSHETSNCSKEGENPDITQESGKIGKKDNMSASAEDMPVTSHGDERTASSTQSPSRRGLRQRTGRGKVNKIMHDESSSGEDAIVAHKQETEELHRKCVKIAIRGSLLALIRRDPLRLFAQPVPDSVVGYRQLITTPIDFGIIRKRTLRKKYHSLSAFFGDVRLLCRNALIFNPSDSIYAKTANALLDSVETMHTRANQWISAVKKNHAAHFSRKIHRSSQIDVDDVDGNSDPYSFLRSAWAGAAEAVESGNWLKAQLLSDFHRTRENESAYYGALAIRRLAIASQATLADAPERGGVHHAVVRRSASEDEALRQKIDVEVGDVNSLIQLKDEPDWREDQTFKILKNVQSRRIELRTTSENGSARCDGVQSEDIKLAIAGESMKRKRKRVDDEKQRVDPKRIHQTTGLASSIVRERFERVDDKFLEPRNEAVRIRGSRIHGWGLYADHPFNKGEVVAEYVGEYISNAVADAREGMYREMKIQDYQFRVSKDLVIDATLRGGYARYINHSCDPNCIAKIVSGEHPNEYLKRAIIVSQRNIQEREEITYDYQFPLEHELESRIPCNCGAKTCRGHMNWDPPEANGHGRAMHRPPAGRRRKSKAQER